MSGLPKTVEELRALPSVADFEKAHPAEYMAMVLEDLVVECEGNTTVIQAIANDAAVMLRAQAAEIDRLRGLLRDAHRRARHAACICGERVPAVAEDDPRPDAEIIATWHAAHVRSLTGEPE